MVFTFEIPYDYRYSKNRKFVSYNSKIISKEYRNALDEIAFLTTPGRKNFQKAKIWVHIMVYKPSNKADAQNFIEPICDGIKQGIDIDDHWFSGSWDWAIDAIRPRIEITIKQ